METCDQPDTSPHVVRTGWFCWGVTLLIVFPVVEFVLLNLVSFPDLSKASLQDNGRQIAALVTMAVAGAWAWRLSTGSGLSRAFTVCLACGGAVTALWLFRLLDFPLVLLQLAATLAILEIATATDRIRRRDATAASDREPGRPDRNPEPAPLAPPAEDGSGPPKDENQWLVRWRWQFLGLIPAIEFLTPGCFGDTYGVPVFGILLPPTFASEFARLWAGCIVLSSAIIIAACHSRGPRKARAAAALRCTLAAAAVQTAILFPATIARWMSQ